MPIHVDLPVPLLPNLELVSIKPNSKPKQSSFDDDPWRLSNSPPTPNLFPVNETKKKSALNETTMDKKLIVQEQETDKKISSAEWFSNLDTITVTVAEKEGFLFPHVNYWVQSSHRQTSVRRRYSDFYWFWETLMKRYPFRVVPFLPPKRFSGSKYYILFIFNIFTNVLVEDDTFIEQRCQGLSRFINCVVRHPVLKSDEVVSIFLTEETVSIKPIFYVFIYSYVKKEFAAWRKGAKLPSTEEEFVRVNPDVAGYEPLIPDDLDSRIEVVKNRLPKSIERYDVLCSTMERMIKLRQERMEQLMIYNKALK